MQEETQGTPLQNDAAAENPDLRNFASMNSGLLLCPHCSAQMPATAAFCPGCGEIIKSVSQARQKVGLFPEKIAGALAYFTFFPAFLFLALEPYRRNQFVRFHSAQCLLLWVATAVVAVLLFMIPVGGPLLVVLISIIALLLGVLTWLVVVVKAFQGERFKLPILGVLAEQVAGPR